MPKQDHKLMDTQNLDENTIVSPTDQVVAAGPVMGEFGWILFDIQDKVRAFFDLFPQAEKVVLCPAEYRPLFETATRFIDIPPDIISRGGGRISNANLVTWAQQQVAADRWLHPPQTQDWRLWQASSHHIVLTNAFRPCEEPYCVLACRKQKNQSKKNWPVSYWDKLLEMIRAEWTMPVVSIGRPEDCYFPTDLRRVVGLEQCIGALNGAQFSVSSNTGLTHLSLLCDCPTFIWGKRKIRGGTLKHRMEILTNPHKTKCLYKPLGWRPDADTVFQHLSKWVNELSK